MSLTRSYPGLTRQQLEVEYEQNIARSFELQNELETIEQKLLSVDAEDYLLLLNEREEFLLQLQRSSSIELDVQKKVFLLLYNINRKHADECIVCMLTYLQCDFSCCCRIVLYRYSTYRQNNAAQILFSQNVVAHCRVHLLQGFVHILYVVPQTMFMHLLWR